MNSNTQNEENLALKLKKYDEKHLVFLSFARLFSPFISSFLAKKTQLHPNQITFLSISSGLLAAFAFATKLYLIAGICLFLWMLLDCVDGELARKTSQLSEFGAKLEIINSDIQYMVLLPCVTFGLIHSGAMDWQWLLVSFIGVGGYMSLRWVIGAYPQKIFGNPTSKLKVLLAIQFKNMKELRTQNHGLSLFTYHIWRNIITQGGILYPLLITFCFTNSLNGLKYLSIVYSFLYALFAFGLLLTMLALALIIRNR